VLHNIYIFLFLPTTSPFFVREKKKYMRSEVRRELYLTKKGLKAQRFVAGKR